MFQEEINEDDEKLFESFFVKDAPRQRTLADIIIKKIKDNDADVAEGLIHVLIFDSILKAHSFFFIYMQKSVLTLSWTLK